MGGDAQERVELRKERCLHRDERDEGADRQVAEALDKEHPAEEVGEGGNDPQEHRVEALHPAARHFRFNFEPREVTRFGVERVDDRLRTPEGRG